MSRRINEHFIQVFKKVHNKLKNDPSQFFRRFPPKHRQFAVLHSAKTAEQNIKALIIIRLYAVSHNLQSRL